MPNLHELGGIDSIISDIKKMILLPLKHNPIFESLHLTPPKGILLTGISGSGKTALGLATLKFLQEELQLGVVYKSATEVVGGLSGESENNVRKMFAELGEEKRILFLGIFFIIY